MPYQGITVTPTRLPLSGIKINLMLKKDWFHATSAKSNLQAKQTIDQ